MEDKNNKQMGLKEEMKINKKLIIIIFLIAVAVLFIFFNVYNYYSGEVACYYDMAYSTMYKTNATRLACINSGGVF